MLHKCPHCQSALEIREEWLGMEISCSSCGKNFTASPAAQVDQVQQVVQPKKLGMLVSWVLCGISALINIGCAISWVIFRLTENELLSQKNYEEHHKFLDDSRSFIDAVQISNSVNLALMIIFLVLATIMTIIYLNRSQIKMGAGWQDKLKRTKRAAVICGILFAINRILIMAIGVTNTVLFMLAHKDEIGYDEVREITAFFSFSSVFNVFSIIFSALAIIFTVKYWILKKSPANQ